MREVDEWPRKWIAHAADEIGIKPSGAHLSGMLRMGWDALLHPLGTDGRGIVANIVATILESTTQDGCRRVTQRFLCQSRIAHQRLHGIHS